MLKLSVNDIVKHNENCYSFVIAVAKRAREISEEAEEEDVLLDEQPVQMAVKEFVEGKFHIREGSEIASGGEDAPRTDAAAPNADQKAPVDGADDTGAAG